MLGHIWIDVDYYRFTCYQVSLNFSYCATIMQNLHIREENPDFFYLVFPLHFSMTDINCGTVHCRYILYYPEIFPRHSHTPCYIKICEYSSSNNNNNNTIFSFIILSMYLISMIFFYSPYSTVKSNSILNRKLKKYILQQSRELKIQTLNEIRKLKYPVNGAKKSENSIALVYFQQYLYAKCYSQRQLCPACPFSSWIRWASSRINSFCGNLVLLNVQNK